MPKDYYAILEISKTATPEEIKKAYRTLALRYHPDKNSHPEAESQFKLVSEAYQVLSDPSKRRNYDLGGTLGGERGEFSSAGFTSPEELFNAFFGNHGFGSFMRDPFMSNRDPFGDPFMSRRQGDPFDAFSSRQRDPFSQDPFFSSGCKLH